MILHVSFYNRNTLWLFIVTFDSEWRQFSVVDTVREATKRARAAQQELDHVRDALDALRNLPAASPELVLKDHDALEAHERRGILHFTLAPFRSGTKILLFSLKDDGGTEQGGQNECTVSLAIVVLPVNDSPHFMLPSALLVVEDAGLLTIRRFAQALSAGGVTDDEAWQTLSFNVEVLERSGSELLPANLFATRPCIQAPQCTSQHVGYCATSRWLNRHLHFEPSLAAVHLTGTEEDSACGGVPAHIDRNGTLRMRTARDQHGTARLKVTVRDDGGRAVGGIDTYGPIEMSLQVLHQPRVFAVIPRFGPISGGNLVTLQGLALTGLEKASIRASCATLAVLAVTAVTLAADKLLLIGRTLKRTFLGLGIYTAEVQKYDPQKDSYVFFYNAADSPYALEWMTYDEVVSLYFVLDLQLPDTPTQDKSVMHTCSQCTAGAFPAEYGIAAVEICLACPAGKYSVQGSGNCYQCPPHSQSPPGSDNCRCNAGFAPPHRDAYPSCVAEYFKVNEDLFKSSLCPCSWEVKSLDMYDIACIVL